MKKTVVTNTDLTKKLESKVNIIVRQLNTNTDTINRLTAELTECAEEKRELDENLQPLQTKERELQAEKTRLGNEKAALESRIEELEKQKISFEEKSNESDEKLLSSNNLTELENKKLQNQILELNNIIEERGILLETIRKTSGQIEGEKDRLTFAKNKLEAEIKALQEKNNAYVTTINDLKEVMKLNNDRVKLSDAALQSVL